MKTDYQLPEEYVQTGFYISAFGVNSLALKYLERTIFVFSSLSDFRDDFISLLCDSYIRLSAKKDKVKVIA